MRRVGKGFGTLFALAVLAGGASAAPAKAVPTAERVAACHQKAADDQQRQKCLEMELELVTAEHKDAVETMMKSLEFADDIAEAKTEAMDVKLDDIEIKR